MDARVEQLMDRYFGRDVHPYRVLEQSVAALVGPGSTLLDAGCGRTAPVLRQFAGRAGRLVGVDLVDFTEAVDGIELYKGDIDSIPMPDRSVDVVYARSVMEHVEHPTAVYREIARVLKPGGHFLFITANLFDYASLIAKLVPNRLHPAIVRRTEGRAEEDVFPTRYRSNTKRAVRRFAAEGGFRVERLDYLGQYPAYCLFSPALFRLASWYELFIRKVPALHCLQGWIFASLQKP